MSERLWALDWKTPDPIEVVRYGFLYRAVGWFKVRPGSGYRAAFARGEGKTAAWAFSAETAGRRCAKRRLVRVRLDEEQYARRQARTTTYREKR